MKMLFMRTGEVITTQENKTATNIICPICQQSGTNLIGLDNYPVTEIYQRFNDNAFEHSTKFDQGLNYCEACQHGYLNTLLPREFIYENYNTHSSASVGSITAIDNFFQFISSRVQNNPGLVIDVGANDTSLLKKFKSGNARLVGIDPNASSDDPEIECIRDYFEDVDLKQIGSSDKLFLCSHTLEHIFNPTEFIDKLSAVSGTGDEFFFQFPSLDLLVRDCRFDQVHHQHIQYFSLSSLTKYLVKSGFEMLDHQFDSDHYGTLMVRFRKSKSALNHAPESERLNCSQILDSYETFTASLCAANKRIDFDGCKFSCFGASLMLPIIAYYMPNLVRAEQILDNNARKFGLSYVNFDREIIDAESFDYTAANIVVTAISTKLATRKIVNKLIDLKTENIVLPFNTL